ncbi:MAG: S9 family peptidase [Candidatus Aminicenantes bacterium]|nr:S9 family peptidase [Candidatus Aminicenantes bacterium]
MKKAFLVLLLALCVMATVLRGEDEKKLTIEDVLRFEVPGSVAISPDGSKVAFVIGEPDFKESVFRSHIWLTDIEGGITRQFTYSQKSERSPRWSPDGSYLAFTSTREEKPQIFLIPVDGGEGVRLTEAEGGIMNFRWMPDGKEIIYLTKEQPSEEKKKEKERKKKEKFDSYVVGEEKYRNQLWKVNIESKKTTKIFDGDYGLSEFEVSPDGKRVAYVTNYTGDPNDGKKRDIWILNLENGETDQLTDFPGAEGDVSWSPDGRQLCYQKGIDPEFSPSETDLYLIPAYGGSPRNLTTKLDLSVGSYRWFPDGEQLILSCSQGVYSHLYTLALRNDKLKPLTEGDKSYSQFDLSRDGRRLVYLLEDSLSFPQLWTATPDNKNPKPITELNKNFQEFAIAPQEVIRWKSTDGWTIEGILVKPLGYQEGQRYPLIVMVHGGPAGRMVNTLTGSSNAQLFAAQGYAVFLPNFRGSSGYDNRFVTANIKDIGGGDYRDIMSGVDYLIERGIADPDRLGVMGGSYGGYMTNWIISQTNRFKAAVSMYGIFNLITDFSNSNIPYWERQYLGDYYWEKVDLYMERSAFSYVRNIRTPVLIMHGDADSNTFISNSVEMYTALKLLKATHEFVRYPREGHGISREPNHIRNRFQRQLRWFNKYILGEEEPQKKEMEEKK